MKKLFFFITIFGLLIGCNVRQKRLVHYLSTLENITTLPPTKEESIIIDSINLRNKKFLEKCQQGGGNCIDDDPFQNARFKKGVTEFRQIIFDKFQINSKSKEGENKILITIGKKDNIEKIEFLKYTDDDSKKQIEEIFKSKELNQWRSAKIYGFPLETQFEISILIENE